jgi:DNA replication initiation complex subunit (GINS family)
VIFSVLATLGAAFYMPIRENSAELRLMVRELDKSQVPRVEHEKIWAFQERLSNIYQKRLERLEDDFYRRSKP